MRVSVENKVVLIAGASSGIGRATATLFAKEGAKVMASARREDRLLGLQQDLKQVGRTIEVFSADAVKPQEMERLVQATEQRLGRIEILVYAIGTNVVNRAMDRLDVETWDMMLNVNLSSAYYVTRAALPAMRQAKSGHLIYISSSAGLRPDASGASYQASKRGLLGLAHAIRFEEKENGIRTCVICPGLTDTELVEKRPEKLTPDVLKRALQPDDVAETILAVAKLPARAAIPEVHMVPSYL